MIPRLNLNSFMRAVHIKIDAAIASGQFDSSQRGLLQATVDRYRSHASFNPASDPLAIIYFIAKAQRKDLGEQAEFLAVFCLFYILSLDLFDDVQDDDLKGKPHEHVGTAIALNTAITLMFLALDALRRVIELQQCPPNRYLELFNRISLQAVAGQHRDLLGAAGAASPAEVLAMQQAKTSSLALVVESAALLSGCDDETIGRYRRIGENFVLLVQLVDDVRDVFGKSVSPDLATGKRTFPLACFMEDATTEQLQQFAELTEDLPASLRQIRVLLCEAGAIQRTAETIERLRSEIHHEFVSLSNDSAYHRTWIQIIDSLASALYSLPPIEESHFLTHPNGTWHSRIRVIARQMHAALGSFDPPEVPPLMPWHLPQWMYDPKRRVIFYPDLEGLPEEIVPFQAELMASDDLETVLAVLMDQAPVVFAHEFFHYWRDVSGNLTQDSWYEEWAANSLAVAYVKVHQPQLSIDTLHLAEHILAVHASGLGEHGKQILERFFADDYGPQKRALGYEVDLEETALIQLAMVQRLYGEERSFEQEVSEFLPVIARRQYQAATKR